jgi:hypothetical protein
MDDYGLTTEDYLRALRQASSKLSEALSFYQQAITSAREAGATWEQLSTAADIPTATARSRHRTAVQGGEMHLHIDPLKDPLEEQDGKSNFVR